MARKPSELTIRPTQQSDIPQIVELQRSVYPAPLVFAPDQIRNQIDVFPDGQMVAVLGDRVVGAVSSLVVLWDDYGLNHLWKEVTGAGYFHTHNLEGRTLYGAEVLVDPGSRRLGIGGRLYAARRQLCQKMNLKRIMAAGRLPGYHQAKNSMSPELYAMRVIWGDVYDPVLRFQLDQGFQYCGIIHGYLPEDLESDGNAALIVWLNPRYNQKRPTRLPRRKEA